MPFPTPEPSLEIRFLPDHTALHFTGCDSLDECNSSAVSRLLSCLPERVVGKRLVIDLNGIRYVTSTALGVLVALNRRVRSVGGTLVLANVGPFVQEALAVTRLDQLMEVLPAEEDAPPAGRLSA